MFDNFISRKEERMKYYEAISNDCDTGSMSIYEEHGAKKERACEVEEKKVPTNPVPFGTQDHDEKLPPIAELKE